MNGGEEKIEREWRRRKQEFDRDSSGITEVIARINTF